MILPLCFLLGLSFFHTGSTQFSEESDENEIGFNQFGGLNGFGFNTISKRQDDEDDDDDDDSHSREFNFPRNKEKFIKELNKTINHLVKNEEKWLKDNLKEVKKNINNYISNIVSGAQRTGVYLSYQFQSFTSSVLYKVRECGNRLMMYLNNMKRKNEEHIRFNYKNLISNKNLTETIENIELKMDNYVSGDEDLDQTIEDIKNNLNSFLQQKITNAKKSINTMQKNLFTNVKNTTNSALNDFGNRMSTYYEQRSKDLLFLVGNIKNQSIDTLDFTVKKLKCSGPKDIKREMTKTMILGIENALKSVSNNSTLDKIIQENKQKLNQTMTQASNDLKKIITNLRTNMTKNIDDSIKNMTKISFPSNTTSLNAKKNNILTYLEENLENVKSGNENMDDVKTKFEELIEILVNDFNSQITSLFRNILNLNTNAFKNEHSLILQGGKQISDLLIISYQKEDKILENLTKDLQSNFRNLATKSDLINKSLDKTLKESYDRLIKEKRNLLNRLNKNKK